MLRKFLVATILSLGFMLTVAAQEIKKPSTVTLQEVSGAYKEVLRSSYWYASDTLSKLYLYHENDLFIPLTMEMKNMFLR